MGFISLTSNDCCAFLCKPEHIRIRAQLSAHVKSRDREVPVSYPFPIVAKREIFMGYLG